MRIYSDHQGIPKILGGMGIVIPPTSCGLVTDREARRKKIGGEILCHVWWFLNGQLLTVETIGSYNEY